MSCPVRTIVDYFISTVWQEIILPPASGGSYSEMTHYTVLMDKLLIDVTNMTSLMSRLSLLASQIPNRMDISKTIECS